MALSSCPIVAVPLTLRACWRVKVLLFTERWSADWQCVWRIIDWRLCPFIVSASVIKHLKYHKKSLLLLFLHNVVFRNEVPYFLVWGIQGFVSFFLPSCLILSSPPLLNRLRGKTELNQCPLRSLLLVFVGGALWSGSHRSSSLSVWIWTEKGSKEPEQVWFRWSPRMGWTS